MSEVAYESIKKKVLCELGLNDKKINDELMYFIECIITATYTVTVQEINSDLRKIINQHKD